MEKVNILGVNIDKATISEATDRICKMMKECTNHSIFTPNSEIVYLAYKDKAFAKLLNSADMLTADGIGVVYASKILKNPISERAGGFDVACSVIERIANSGEKLFLFGGKPNVAELAKENLLKKYPNLNIAGTRNGYFKPQENDEIIECINNSKADIVFVCLGAPMQEKWIFENKDKLNCRVMMGIGGSLDVFAGVTERAPEKWQKLGLEWLYRLKKEPKRFFRMLALPKFALTVIFKGKRYNQEV